MDYLQEFIEDNNLGIREGGIVGAGNRGKDISTLHRKYKKNLPDGQMLLSQKDFKDKLFDIMPDRNPKEFHAEYSIPSVETEKELVELCMKVRGIIISPTGEEISMKGNTLTNVAFEALVSGFLVKYNNESQQLTEKGSMTKLRRTYEDGNVKRIVAERIVKSDHDNRAKLQVDLKYKGEKHAQYTKDILTRLLTQMKPKGVTHWDVDFHVLMLMQWMWQVKQHLYPIMKGNKFQAVVKDYYFINFSSPSGKGAGKTTFVRKLTDCLSDYVYEANLQNVASTSDHAMFSNNYVVFFDELSFGSIPAGDRGKVITGFKWILTTVKIAQRIFNKQSFQKMRRTFSGIGTSNGSLTDAIYDPTGMRRFYEIVVSAERNEKRYKYINELDSLKMWQGIDEDNLDGFVPTGSPNFNKLQMIQDTYMKHDALDMYLISVQDEPLQALLKSESEEGERITVLANKISRTIKKDDYSKALGKSITTIQEFRNDLVSFYDEDPDQRRWLPQGPLLARKLKEKGYLVLHHNNADYIIQQ